MASEILWLARREEREDPSILGDAQPPLGGKKRVRLTFVTVCTIF